MTLEARDNRKCSRFPFLRDLCSRCLRYQLLFLVRLQRSFNTLIVASHIGCFRNRDIIFFGYIKRLVILIVVESSLEIFNLYLNLYVF